MSHTGFVSDQFPSRVPVMNDIKYYNIDDREILRFPNGIRTDIPPWGLIPEVITIEYIIERPKLKKKKKLCFRRRITSSKSMKYTYHILAIYLPLIMLVSLYICIQCSEKLSFRFIFFYFLVKNFDWSIKYIQYTYVDSQ